MSHVVVCSICSRAKRYNQELLPARQRYTGSHISKVEEVARQKEQPFFILSGRYGFVSADEAIPYYDHLLTREEVNALAMKVRFQLKTHGVTECHFYTKRKSNWEPYLDVLIHAARALNVRLRVHELAGDE